MSVSIRKINNHGQNITEFSLVLIVVMIGIIIMSPYVIRSWNANLKGWEDSVTDSFNDPLTEAPPDGLDLPFCDCDPFADVACAAGINTPLGNIQCAPTQMLQTRKCRPQDCEWSVEPPPVTAQCPFDDRCCTDPTPTVCGANANKPPISGTTCPPTYVWDDERGFCTCPDETMEVWQLCGASKVRKYSCDADPIIAASCIFNCLNVPPPSVRTSGLCPNDDKGLLGDTQAIPTAACSQPNGSFPKCEYKCTFPFVPQGSTCACPPSPPSIENPPGSGNWEVIICKNVAHFNLRNALPGNLGSDPVNILVTIDPGIGVYGANTNPAFVTGGGYPAGSTITIVNKGRIEGRGGRGGDGRGSEGCPGGSYYRGPGGYGGSAGGALVLNHPVTINNTNGRIYGGGGGGGAGSHKCTYQATGGGGGGAGWTPGAGGSRAGEARCHGGAGRSGTLDSGGAAGSSCCGTRSGRGGNPGERGQNGLTRCGAAGGSTGGSGGFSIQANGNAITWTGGHTPARVKPFI